VAFEVETDFRDRAGIGEGLSVACPAANGISISEAMSTIGHFIFCSRSWNPANTQNVSMKNFR
jgi:hypothetical protein